mgnify:FL=1
MNKIEHLLICLSEECAEVIKSTDKALRFGLGDSHPSEAGSNYERIEHEINDLYGVIELLSMHGIYFPRDDRQVKEKIEKIRHYMEYAEARGTIRDEKSCA